MNYCIVLAIARADENELKAIGNVFAKDNSIKVGSVKSNMGNSESASGICALTKVIINHQTNYRFKGLFIKQHLIL